MQQFGQHPGACPPRQCRPFHPGAATGITGHYQWRLTMGDQAAIRRDLDRLGIPPAVYLELADLSTEIVSGRLDQQAATFLAIDVPVGLAESG